MLRREVCGYQSFICILQTLAPTVLVNSIETYLASNCDVLFEERLLYVLSIDLNIFSRTYNRYFIKNLLLMKLN